MFKGVVVGVEEGVVVGVEKGVGVGVEKCGMDCWVASVYSLQFTIYNFTTNNVYIVTIIIV